MAEAQEPNTDQTKMEEAQDVHKLTQQLGELDVSEKNTIIDTMWDTVLDHRYGYANGPVKTTHLVCKIDGKTIREKNTHDTERKHAEINFIEYLQTNSVAGKHLTVYINNSPCHVCANALKDYLTKNKDFNFTIYVTHLYNIKRKSCQLNNDGGKENHMDFITNTSHEDTYQGLKNLLKERCTIQAFTKKVWKDLHEVMGLTEDSQQRMETYSTKNTEKRHDRSREREDKNIESDLKHLQANDPWHEIQMNS